MKEVLKEIILILFFLLGVFLKLFNIPNIVFLWNVALALLVYFSALNIPIEYLHHHNTKKGLNLLIMTFLINMIFMTLALYYVLHIQNILLAMFFSAVICGVAVSSHKIMGYEALLSPILSILIPVIFLEVLSRYPFYLFSFQNVVFPIVENLLLSLGCGVAFAILSVLISKKISVGHHFAAIALFFFADFLKASGVIAVFMFGLFLGNINTKKHHFNMRFVDYALFTVAGYLIYFHNLLVLTALFLFFLFLRYIAIEFAFFKEDSVKKMDLLLLRKKGSTTIAMALLLGSYVIKGSILFEYQAGLIINLILYFVILSNIISYICEKYHELHKKKQSSTIL